MPLKLTITLLKELIHDFVDGSRTVDIFLHIVFRPQCKYLPFVSLINSKQIMLYKVHFLTEIFIQDINESEYPGVYVEKGYRDSIFHAVETDD